MEQPLHSNNRNIQYLSKNSRRAKKLTAAIARMIILDLQPYSKVDNIGLQSLLKIAEPRYEIPSHATFSRSIILYMNNALRKDIQSKVNTDIKEDN
ncbi:Zinc finger BED domain-containing protein 4 [Melipona quadrifasciata]|uniref:Zinc finger BED domain-containing protein 4 n=1 Tax=Melipona quadrifasciata TaxID=166423 RepID=A0A0M9A827_9HYME|nr:Zinc finger BED domain-containing protein 4 [Melipona quadrifasciata]